MPKSVDTTTTARRKSGRVRKQLTRTTYEEDSDYVGSRMPEGFNPSDDSEDEYIPPNQVKRTSNAASKSRKRGESGESDSDSEYEGRAPAKKMKLTKKTSSISTPQSRKRSAAPSSQGRSTPIPLEKKSLVSTPTPLSPFSSASSPTGAPSTAPSQRRSPPEPSLGVGIKEEGVQCPKEGCGQTFSLNQYKITFIKLHLANNHYYVDRVPLEDLRPVDDDGTGWAKDDKSKTYSCDSSGSRACSRKMGYRELYVHICNVHNHLEQLMMEDPSEEVREFMKQIYPPAEEEQVVIKKEKCDPVIPLEDDNYQLVTKAEPVMNAPLEDANVDPDDPSPAPAPGPARKGPASVPTPRSRPTPVSSKPAQVVVNKPRPVMNSLLEDDNVDPDDPSPLPAPVPAPVRKVQAYVPTARPRPTPVVPKPVVMTRSTPSLSRTTLATPRPSVDRIINCFLCNGSGKSNKEGRNLNSNTGLQSLKFHFATCIFDLGGFIPYVDPQQGEGRNKLKGGEEEVIDIAGKRWKYKCPFEDCDNNKGKVKPLGYREMCLHLGGKHGLVELWARDQASKEAQELYQILRRRREEEEEGEREIEMPPLKVEEFHTCLVCSEYVMPLSREVSDMKHLRYHYASCLYKTEVYFSMYPPGEENMVGDGSGRPRDERGTETKYDCVEKGCTETKRRKIGYMEYVTHRAVDHGGLEEIMESHDNEEMRNFNDRLKTFMNKLD